MPPTPPPAPQIFNTASRLARRRRAQSGFAAHDFVHQRAAEDIVDRLETVLKRFEQALFYGPGAALTRQALTEKADVGNAMTADDLPAPEIDIVAPPTALPFADGQFDAVASVMALHAVNDLPGALVEARRVLKPDGLFIALFPGERTGSELRESLRTAEAMVTGRVAPRMFPFVAVRDGGSLLQRAGFALPVADIVPIDIAYTDISRLFADLRGTGETAALVEGGKGGLRRDVVAAATAHYEREFPADEGGLRATVDLLALTGWAPHKSQPKPLKPGSATASMAEAIRESSPNSRS